MKNIEILYLNQEKNCFPTFKVRQEETFLPDSIEGFIDKNWQKALERSQVKNILLYNGKLIDLITYNVKTGNKLEIGYSVSDYKTYVGSREKEFSDRFSNAKAVTPITICTAIITRDKKIITEKRNGVDLDDGKFHVIGGYIDPEKDISVNGEPDPIAAAYREVEEETGIQLDIEDIFLLGLVKDKLVPHYEFCYLAETPLLFSEALILMERSKTDGEVTELRYIEADRDRLQHFIRENQGKISTTGESCLLLAGRKLFGNEWYEYQKSHE